MKIIADENILGAGPCFGQFGEVTLLAGRSLRRQDLVDADVLIVRSVTRVDRALLEGTRVRFVGSCTIGTDHLDTAYLTEQGIQFCSAPGSNADSVVDYVLSALANLPGLLEDLLRGDRVGIFGLGNVGGRLARRLTQLGIHCDGYDPLLDPASQPLLQPLAALKRCRVLSLHTPLTKDGPFPSRHLLDWQWLCELPAEALVLNAGRGGVLATEALVTLKQQRPDIHLVLDVWENEPAVSPALAEVCRFATPHIAGYSADGKLNGLRQVAAVLARFLNVDLVAPSPPAALASGAQISLTGDTTADRIRCGVAGIYDIRQDDLRFRASLREVDPSAAFDRLRKHYPLRRELRSAVLADAAHASPADVALFRALTGQDA